MLCERCGYELSDIPVTSVCPECALPIAESRPSTRPGTAWQRAWNHGNRLLPLAWFQSTAFGLLAPAKQMRRAAIVPGGARALLRINLLIASVLLTLQSAGAIRSALISNWPAAILPTPAVALGPTWKPASVGIVFLLWFGLLWLLTRIERIGIHFYARRRGWRIGPVLSLIGTAHASGAWIAAAIATPLLPIALDWLVRALPPAISIYLSGFQVIAMPLGFISCMIWFELATFFGLRVCRFANPPGVRMTDA